jgi:small-conductance mechanosensitive channel
MKVFGHLLPVPPWVLVPAYLILLLLLCRLLSAALEAVFRRWARLTPSQLDDLLVGAIHGPLVLALFLGGLHLGLAAVELTPSAERVGLQALQLGVIFLIAFVGVRLLGLVVAEWGRRTGAAQSLTGPASALGKIIIVAVALIMAADALGIAIAPLVTTLGLGSLAVALALQDTLANFFSGLYLLAEEPIRVGDYVKLDSGEEGYVAAIGWRSTRIRQLANNIVVVPNQKLSQAIVTNYYLPDPRMSLLLRVGVSYGSDPRRVVEVLTRVAREAVVSGEVPGLLAEPEPFVRFIPGFGDSSLDFTLIVQVREFTDQYAVQDELRKRILEAFRREGIEIPFPQRVVHLRAVPDGDGRPAGT